MKPRRIPVVSCLGRQGQRTCSLGCHGSHLDAGVFLNRTRIQTLTFRVGAAPSFVWTSLSATSVPRLLLGMRVRRITQPHHLCAGIVNGEKRWSYQTRVCITAARCIHASSLLTQLPGVVLRLTQRARTGKLFKETANFRCMNGHLGNASPAALTPRTMKL